MGESERKRDKLGRVKGNETNGESERKRNKLGRVKGNETNEESERKRHKIKVKVIGQIKRKESGQKRK
jgi:hypothetical protein